MGREGLGLSVWGELLSTLKVVRLLAVEHRFLARTLKRWGESVSENSKISGGYTAGIELCGLFAKNGDNSMTPAFSTRPLSSATWSDFVSLLSTDKQCAECWCLNHREAAGCATGIEAQRRMRELVAQSRAQGLLAYAQRKGDDVPLRAGTSLRNLECIGWISIDPMESLVGHDCQSSGKPGEWAIHCVFVKAGFRGQGVSRILIEAAVAYARAAGASLVSAFPIPSENRGQFPEGEAEFSGRLSSYVKAGFRKAGESSRFYQRVELLKSS